MQRKLTIAAVAGALAVGGAAVAIPALADASPTSAPSAGATPGPGGSPADRQADRQAERKAAIRASLQSLVDDKTLTADQADKVAQRLSQPGALGRPGGPDGPGRGTGGSGWGRGHGRGGALPGPGMGEAMQAEAEAAAKVLGISVDQLRTALRQGTTLADLAKQHGKSEDDLVDALVAVAKTRLADAVKSGRITQQRADEIGKDLPARIRDIVDHGRRGGHGGGFGRDGDHVPGPSSSPSPSSSASPSLS